jgi:hypothetical protein
MIAGMTSSGREWSHGNRNISGLFEFEWRSQKDVIGFDREQRVFNEEMHRDERW